MKNTTKSLIESYKTRKQAEKLAKRIRLKGIRATVNSYTTDFNETRYGVYSPDWKKINDLVMIGVL